MGQCNEQTYHDFEKFAQSMGMSPEEYALSLHEKNKAVKSLLLDNAPEFKGFVKEYHHLLDELTLYKETDAKNYSEEHYQTMKQVVDLMLASTKDPMLLALMYQTYRDKAVSSSNSH